MVMVGLPAARLAPVGCGFRRGVTATKKPAGRLVGRAGYGSRTRLAALGRLCTADMPIPHFNAIIGATVPNASVFRTAQEKGSPGPALSAEVLARRKPRELSFLFLAQVEGRIAHDRCPLDLPATASTPGPRCPVGQNHRSSRLRRLPRPPRPRFPLPRSRRPSRRSRFVAGHSCLPPRTTIPGPPRPAALSALPGPLSRHS